LEENEEDLLIPQSCPKCNKVLPFDKETVRGAGLAVMKE